MDDIIYSLEEWAEDAQVSEEDLRRAVRCVLPSWKILYTDYAIYNHQYNYLVIKFVGTELVLDDVRIIKFRR